MEYPDPDRDEIGDEMNKGLVVASLVLFSVIAAILVCVTIIGVYLNGLAIQ